MTIKSDTIAEIMSLNPTVGAAFLSEFSVDDLIRYLRRLRDLRETGRPAILPRKSPSRSPVEALQTA